MSPTLTGLALANFGPGIYATGCEVMWIEFKSSKGKLQKHQLEWITKERARGALVVVAGMEFGASVDGFRDWYRNSGLCRSYLCP